MASMKKGTPAQMLEWITQEDEKRKRESREKDDLLRKMFMESVRENNVDQQIAEFLGKRSEKDITAEAKVLLTHLRNLYLERRGMILHDDPNGDLTWCATCGVDFVDCPEEGPDCQDCRVANR